MESISLQILALTNLISEIENKHESELTEQDRKDLFQYSQELESILRGM